MQKFLNYLGNYLNFFSFNLSLHIKSSYNISNKSQIKYFLQNECSNQLSDEFVTLVAIQNLKSRHCYLNSNSKRHMVLSQVPYRVSELFYLFYKHCCTLIYETKGE